MTKQLGALRPASRIGGDIVQKKEADFQNTEACRIALESSRKQLAPSLPSVPPHETGQYSLCRPSIQVESMFSTRNRSWAGVHHIRPETGAQGSSSWSPPLVRNIRRIIPRKAPTQKWRWEGSAACYFPSIWKGFPSLYAILKHRRLLFVDPPLSLWLCHRKWLILYFLKF